MANFSDYLLTSALTGKPGFYVRLLNNSSGTSYISDTVTDVNGKFTFNPTSPPPGSYTVFYGLAATVPGTATATGDANYLVPVSAGDDAALKSLTLSASSPYSAFAVPGSLNNVIFMSAPTGSDDTANLNTAHANLPSTGGIIVLGTGTYNITPGLVNITKPCELWGMGKDATKVQARAVAGNQMLLVTGVANFTIQSMTLDGTNLTGSIAGILSILGGSTNVRVRWCRIQNSTAGNAVTLTNVQRAWIEENDFSSHSNSGVYLGDPGVGNFNDHIWIKDNNFAATGGPVGADGNAAIQCVGIRIAIMHRYVHVIGNHVAGSQRVGIACNMNDWLWIENNRVDNTGATGEAIAYTGTHVRVRGNYAQSGSGAAAILKWALLGHGNDHDEIAFNECTGSTGQQIAIAWGTTGGSPAVINDLFIHDNECYGAGSVGIQSFLGPGVTVATWTNVVVKDNKLIGVLTSTTWVGAAGNPAIESNNTLTTTGYTPITTQGAPLTAASALITGGQLTLNGALGIPLLLAGVDGGVSYIVAQIKSGTSGFPSHAQFTDGVTYNASFGTEANGDFAWYSGRFPGTAGTKRLLLSTAGDLTLPNASRLLTVQATAPTVGSGGAGVSALSVIAGGSNLALQVQATLTAIAPGVVVGVVAFNGGPLATAPKAVVCSLSAPTAGVAAPPIVGADAYTTTGFTIRSYGPTTVTTGTYIITCWVLF